MKFFCAIFKGNLLYAILKGLLYEIFKFEINCNMNVA